METLLTVIAILFLLLLFALVVATLINTITEIKANKNIGKHNDKVEYILEVTEVGEIKLHKKNRGGGFNYRQF